jgi:hypothetical protein
VAIAALLRWWLAQKRRRWTQLNSCESAAYLYWLMNTTSTYYVLDISFKNVPQFECVLCCGTSYVCAAKLWQLEFYLLAHSAFCTMYVTQSCAVETSSHCWVVLTEPLFVINLHMHDEPVPRDVADLQWRGVRNSNQ